VNEKRERPGGQPGLDRKKARERDVSNHAYSTTLPSESQLPCCIPAERALLGGLLISDGHFQEIATVLQPAAFYSEAHQIIFGAMLALVQKGRLVDYIALKDELQSQECLETIGGDSYLVGLIGGAETSTLPYLQNWAQIVNDKARQRQVIAIAGGLARVGYAGDGYFPTEVARLRDDLDRAIAVRNGEMPVGTTWAEMRRAVGPITWAWERWLPAGMLAMLAGDLGVGKSLLTLRVAACFLCAAPWPDDTPYTGEEGSILWLEAEAAQALNLERATAWGLPLDRILTPFADPLMDVQLDVPEHQRAITAMAFRPDVRFVVVDSLRGAHRGDENSSDMIHVMGWLAELARDTGKPVLLLHHLRKRGFFDGTDGGVTLDRLRGSSAIAQTTRVVWALDMPDPNSEARRLSVIKNNLARFPQPLGFTISDIGVTFCAAPETPKKDTLQDRAADLLLALLAHQPMRATEIQREVEGAGLSWYAAQRAKDKLRIVAKKEADGWYWALPVRE
jgi:hypothetical protein